MHPTHSHEPVELLWIGDAAPAVEHFARRAPHVRISAAEAPAAVESLQAGSQADLVVLDATPDGADVSGVLGRLQAAQIDLPVLLLTRPGAEDLAIQAGRFAVCDCVVKSPEYLLQVLPAIGQLRARHDLVALFRTNRQNQDRLRTILEFQPAVTAVISREGIVTAMNQAGLSRLGMAREQVVGRPFAHLLPEEARLGAVAFIEGVCRGEAAGFDHVVLRDGGRRLEVRTRAVPFRNADHVVALATIEARAAAATGADAELQALSAAALADALAEVESLREQREGWASQRIGYEARAREAAAHADAVLRQAQADASTLVRERTEWALERQQAAQHQREAERTAADLAQATAALTHVHEELARAQASLEPLRLAQAAFDVLSADLAPLRAELDSLRAERTQSASEREQWLEERRQVEARLNDAGQAESIRKELQDERDSLTRVLHSVTGRCELLEADVRRANAAARDALDRQSQDAAALTHLEAERTSLAQALEAVQAQVTEAVAALDTERAAWAHERDHAAAQRQQAFEALDAERERASALADELQAARANYEELTELRHAAERDREALLKLRDDLLRFMADADAQCGSLIEQHDRRLAPTVVSRNRSTA